MATFNRPRDTERTRAMRSFAGNAFEGGFNDNLFQDSIAAPQAEKKIVSALTHLRDKFNSLADTDEEALSEGLVGENISLRRKIVIAGGSAVDKDDMLALHRLYVDDQKNGIQLLTALNDITDPPDDATEEWFLLNRCAVRALLIPYDRAHPVQNLFADLCPRRTDQVAEKLGYVQPRNGFPPETTNLLGGFFEICQFPNRAEVALLSEAADLQELSVVKWCTLNLVLFDAQDNALID